MRNRVLHADSLEFLPDLQTDSVDLIFTDPPYNISEGKTDLDGLDDVGKRGPHGGLGSVKQHYGDWDEGDVPPAAYAKDLERILKETGTLFIFYDPMSMAEMRLALQDAGFEEFTKAYWVKSNPVPRVRVNQWMTAVEEMLVATRGGQANWINEELPQRSHAIHAPIVGGHEYAEHPTQKPVKVAEEVIRYFCPEDGVVLDPFLGSGTTAVAAEKVGRDWIGIEREEEYVEMARERLREETYHGTDNALEEEWA